MPHKPSWFQEGFVVISNAPTCGINKDGSEQYRVDPITGARSDSEINDKLFEDAIRISEGNYDAGNVFTQPLEDIKQSKVYVPQYHDFSSLESLEGVVKSLPGFTTHSLGSLVKQNIISVFYGHGSPSADQRVGDIPYIKVSDLRAGHVNVNPTNLIPLELAKAYWRGNDSGLRPYDLLSPERASKNIGEFCVLMPGQERIVLTKEIIAIRSTDESVFDQFYLMWALTLTVVRSQWRRVILMQTNREDVGARAFEIQIPVPPSKSAGEQISSAFRNYYQALEQARNTFTKELAQSPFKHHVFLT